MSKPDIATFLQVKHTTLAERGEVSHHTTVNVPDLSLASWRMRNHTPKNTDWSRRPPPPTPNTGWVSDGAVHLLLRLTAIAATEEESLRLTEQVLNDLLTLTRENLKKMGDNK